MVRHLVVAFVALLALAPNFSGQGARASEYDHLVAKHAAAHGVPEALVRRIIQIETRGNPQLVSKGNYGLMQIRLETARAMGYRGDADGLLDADTNMTYAVRYLAGAYRAAGGNSEQAIRNYQRGYYNQAKAQGVAPYAVASAPPQAAAPDPILLRQQQEIERRKAAEQQRQAMLEARVEQRKMAEQERNAQRLAMLQARADQQKAAEQQRLAQRQAMMQERIDRQYVLQQRRIEQQNAVEERRLERHKVAEQKRTEQRQAMLQQKAGREDAKPQEQTDPDQAKQPPLEQGGEQPKAEQPRPPSAQTAPARKRAADSGYAWYNPMRFFKHPAHQAHPLQRDR